MPSQLSYSYEIRLTIDCKSKGIIKNHVILANIAIITACNTACFSVYFFRVNRWCNQLFQICISFIYSTKAIFRKQNFECIITV